MNTHTQRERDQMKNYHNIIESKSLGDSNNNQPIQYRTQLKNIYVCYLLLLLF